MGGEKQKNLQDKARKHPRTFSGNLLKPVGECTYFSPYFP
jgi:hypothetical protein